MKTSREMRAAAWQLMVAERRGWRVFGEALSFMLLAMVGILAVGLLYEKFGVQTWGDFNEARLEAQMEGLTMVPPNRTAICSYTYGSVFQYLIQLLISGMTAMGLSAVALKVVDRAENAAGTMFVGLKYPLGCMWLQFLRGLLILLWSLLLVIPGFVAYYRYRQAWYLKVEHPDWSAGKCLKESGQLMRGNKWRMFCFDCSYWLSFLLPCVLVIVGEVALIAGFNPEAEASVRNSAIGALAMLAALPACIFVSIYFLLGHAVFYRELNHLEEKKDDALNW